MVRCNARPRCGKKIIYAVVVLLLPIYLIGYMKHRMDHNRCMAHLAALCKEYRHGFAYGNMCSNVCSANQYDVTCLQEATVTDGDPTGKWVLLFQHTITSAQFILKSDSSRNSRAAETVLTLKLFNNITDAKTFQFVLRKSFNLKSNKTHFDAFHKHLNLPEHLRNPEETLLILHQLMGQDELMNLYNYRKLPYVMKLYGVCGNHYAVEYLESTTHYISAGNTRLKLALSYLNLIEQMDNLHQVQLCDVKPPNYGQRSTGEVVLIDIDTTFYETELQQILGNSTCSANGDPKCNFWDCLGVCDVENRQCKSIHQNTNLQAVCYKIFSGNTVDLSSGLLVPPFFQSWPEISKLLDICLQPNSSIPKDKLLNQLRNAIRKQLKEK